MVPLQLRLKNFLSYGEDPPVLDLENIHVACLSGGNGQGKSALLDAMTWAVWGEARKSSEARKPDEDLLRIGARVMEVDFSFRVGDAELRVVRSYTESASGKSSKPGLELQIRDGDDWQALTAGSLRATQAAIDERIGIDYETFVNSTFLLQGRSDEFTKKKPGERKEILGKILALDRYDRMAAAAGRRWSKLRERANALEAERDRLDGALGPLEEWQLERSAVAEAVVKAEAELKTAQHEEQQAAAALATLDAVAREAETLRSALTDLADRTARVDKEDRQLGERIVSADALVADSDRIEADNARYETLRAQRTELDEKATLFRAIDNQRHGLRLEMQQKTAEAKADLVKLKGALDVLDRQIAADQDAVAGQEETQRQLARATDAQGELKRLDAVRKARDERQRAVDEIDKQLDVERRTLQGRREQVVAEGKRLKQEVDAVADIDMDSLSATVADGKAAEVRREALQQEGTEHAADVKAFDATLESLTHDRTRVMARVAKIESSSDEVCPTCGSDLSDAHRLDVLAGFADDIARIDADIADAKGQRADAIKLRDALRVEYQALAAPIEAGAKASVALQTGQDRLRQRDDAVKRVQALRAEVRVIKDQLDQQSFGQQQRSERAAHVAALDADSYDAEAHAAARDAAALREHWGAEVRKLAVAAERLEQSRARRERDQRTLAERRASLDRGEPTAELKRKMDVLDQQVATLGFDAAQHERVGRTLRDLADAPKRLSALLDARRRRADDAERRAQLADDRRALVADSAVRQKTLDGLTERLAQRESAEQKRGEAVQVRESVSARLAQARGQLGALDERLARAERDRTRRAEVAKELRDVVKDRALYGHLRRAFGKNGIPSLIIEETLPEIETRANTLLERLSKGRTRVALETLKDKKTGGGTKETLDIRITDDNGAARSYETFSGGEAFRVNFALRIALSQMLAERSGTQIRTLVIDEGFGTQDAEGLQALIGAIRAIQNDFETILVITHLDEIKDAFPVRIEVRKEPVTGSTFDVIGG